MGSNHDMTGFLASMTVLGTLVEELTTWSKDDLVVPLLILVLGVALGMFLICLLLAVHFVGKRQSSESRQPWSPQEVLRTGRLTIHRIFTPPDRWLAIRGEDLALVQATLGLQRPRPCSWEEGLNAIHGQKLFISPPCKGWILVMGPALPDPAEDVDRCFRFLLHLSRKLGHVQFFGYNRILNHHGWAVLSEGTVSRAYIWADQTLWNQGRLTREEIDLGLRCFDYGEVLERDDFSQADPAAVNVERVPALAARWSLDPTAINARTLRQSQGIAGRFPRPIVY